MTIAIVDDVVHGGDDDDDNGDDGDNGDEDDDDDGVRTVDRSPNVYE